MKPLASGQETIIAALDVGSSKVACLIAERTASGTFHVKGVGNRACNGGAVGGAIVDMELTEKAIRASVDQAEKMAGITVSDVMLTFSGGEPKSQVVEVEVDVTGHAVSDADITKAMEQAKAQIDFDEEGLLHAFPVAYAVDGHFGPREPVGMCGKKLSVAVLIVTAASGPLRNLKACVRRAHLNVSSVVLTPFAAGLSCLVEDEAKMGAACIDMGGGTTGISIFAQGALVHAEVIPLGGSQVTEEVARGLLTPFEHAERLKTFNGAAIVDPADARLEIEVPQVGEEDSDQMARMPRSALTSIIQKEMELLFTTIAERLDASGFSGVAGKRVVLTGGVAQCEAVRDLATRVLGRQVRIGRPRTIEGLPVAAQMPNFSALAGLLEYAVRRPKEVFRSDNKKHDETTGATGPLGRMVQWVRDNF
ncbi:cell division protein FtsA [Kordiimonas pumila]|uniref:Cell division protein FtsA n=1 Tax=Kordiimonas pumila TaxID=2161677 RepID=A0ABV7D8M9_9PROT|nr:cell division protein FtsA [Kordiimonas pumila]